MHGRRDTERERAGPIRAGADERDDEHEPGQADDAVGVIGAEEHDRIRRPVFGGAGEEDQERCGERQPEIAAERPGEHRERLKARHAEDAAENLRQRDL